MAVRECVDVGVCGFENESIGSRRRGDLSSFLLHLCHIPCVSRLLLANVYIDFYLYMTTPLVSVCT